MFRRRTPCDPRSPAKRPPKRAANRSIASLIISSPVRFGSASARPLGIEYNDNINLAEVNTQEDVIFRPQVNLNALWPITQLNTLRFDIGLGYAFYGEHSEYNTSGLLLSPGSQLSFDIFVSDFRINFHDRFSLEQDPIDEPAISNVADYGRFENTAGVSVLWDLNKAVVTFGYDHYTFIATNDDFEYLDRDAEILMATVSVAATSTTGVGLETSYVFNRYDQDQLNDSDTLSIGGFVETAITSYLKAARGGRLSDDRLRRRRSVARAVSSGFLPSGAIYQVFSDDAEPRRLLHQSLALTPHQRRRSTHSLSAGHEAQLGVNSNYITLNYIRHTATWNIINRTLLSTEFFYEDAEESGGFIDEHLHRYGGALSAWLSTHPARHPWCALSIHTERFGRAVSAITARTASRSTAPIASKSEIVGLA